MIKITTTKAVSSEGLPKFILKRGKKIEAQIYETLNYGWYLEQVVIHQDLKSKEQAFHLFKKDYLIWLNNLGIKEDEVKFDF